MQHKKSLAEFVSETREQVGLSQTGLAKKSGLPLKTVEDIESGVDLFLSSGIRQKLAKGLKLMPREIKIYEKTEDISLISDARYIEEIKNLILENPSGKLSCPVCKADLVTRVAKMYDLEDNLVLHPKAHCTKCAFQISK